MPRSILCSAFALLLIAVPATGHDMSSDQAAFARAELDQAQLQARFADIQHAARPGRPAFELRLIDDPTSLFVQHNDGTVRLPAAWAKAARDAGALDYVMLLALSEALVREPVTRRASSAEKLATGALGLVGRSVAESRADRAGVSPADYLAQPEFRAPLASGGGSVPAQTALIWAATSGACEAKIVAGLASLRDEPGQIGHDARTVLRQLGPLAWSPDARCGRARG